MTDIESYMALAAETACDNTKNNAGGPFGAVIVKDDNIIAVAANSVIADHDPTAHAEINAIRKAAGKLGTHDLSGCVLYATGYPCPMCMSAIIWANIDQVYYALDLDSASEIGFRDNDIYAFLKGEKDNLVKIEKLNSKACEGLYAEYIAANGVMY